MSVLDSASASGGRHRRTSKGRVRAIEYRRRTVGASEPADAASARYVGRVGALAVALGIGSIAGSLPMAFADTTGSAGATGTDASANGSPPSTKASRGRPATPSSAANSPRSGALVSPAPALRHNDAPGAPEVRHAPTVVPAEAPRTSVADQPAKPVATLAAAGAYESAPVTAPVPVAIARPAAAHHSASSVTRAAGSVAATANLLSWLATGGGQEAAPLAWTALAVSRREVGANRTDFPVAAVRCPVSRSPISSGSSSGTAVRPIPTEACCGATAIRGLKRRVIRARRATGARCTRLTVTTPMSTS